MPTHRPKPSARIDLGSGRKNHGRLDRRSSARWRSGWRSSKSGSSIRMPVPASNQPGGAVRAVSRASFRWHPRNGWSVRARRPSNRNPLSNPGEGAGGGAAAAEGSRPARRLRRRFSNRGQIDRRCRSGSPECRGRSDRVPAPPSRVSSKAKRVASSRVDGGGAVAGEAVVEGRKGRSQGPEVRLPQRRDLVETLAE